MGLAEAEQWLDGLINRERQPRVAYSRFGLEAIAALLERLGNPERGLSVIHVAGSKGKGSVALLGEALLRELGESVGTFTSPHLVRWTERFRLDGREVDGERLARAVARVRPHVDAMRQEDSSLWPSFFDATTAAAYLLFADAGVDRVMLEVGLGGRLDSTNTVAPAATCVTSIEYEHTDKLGETLAEIAAEKAGILKPGVPCITGPLPAPAAKVVEERAASLGAPLLRVGEEIALEGRRLHFIDGFCLDVQLSVAGDHQVANAAIAIAAVRALGPHADERVAEAAGRAFRTVSLPGRIEIVERRPWVIVDAAHTTESVRALATFVAGIEPRRRHFVLSVSLDKKLEPILDLLLPLAAELTVTRADPIRGVDPEEVARRVRARGGDVAVRIVEDPAAAVRVARADLPADALLCVVGSVYLAGIARAELLGP